MKSRALSVATHNIMDGLRLSRLLPHYLNLQQTAAVSVLCIQENAVSPLEHFSHAEKIATSLGADFCFHSHPHATRLATVYDGRELTLEDQFVIELPKLRKLNLISRLYMASDAPEDKHALVSVFRLRDSRRLVVVNFHLDAAGDNEHRALQIRVLAAELVRRGLTESLVVCGDTNAFTFRRSRHRPELDRILSPLSDFGVRDLDTRDSHYFSRAREPKWGQRIAVAVGKLGIDMPRRYDVVCTNLPVRQFGHEVTPDSDHDLVWASLEI